MPLRVIEGDQRPERKSLNQMSAADIERFKEVTGFQFKEGSGTDPRTRFLLLSFGVSYDLIFVLDPTGKKPSSLSFHDHILDRSAKMDNPTFETYEDRVVFSQTVKALLGTGDAEFTLFKGKYLIGGELRDLSLPEQA